MDAILLSPPHLTGLEGEAVVKSLRSGWLAPSGPELGLFETEFCQCLGFGAAAALSSCSAGLIIALKLAGVSYGDIVLCSDFSFAAPAFAACHLGAELVFVDCDEISWNIDPSLLEDAIKKVIKSRGFPPKAAIVVNCYGQSPDMYHISRCCQTYGIKIIEDCAAALGSQYSSNGKWLSVGKLSDFAVFSFNGNKIVTCGGGGMFVAKDSNHVEDAIYLATQAKSAADHYHHLDIGFNFRLSSVLAAIGRVQLRDLPNRLIHRKQVFKNYADALKPIPGFDLMPEPSWSRSNRWLSCLTIDSRRSSASAPSIGAILALNGIETRRLWKPLHLQPIFRGSICVGRGIAQKLFDNGLCLPSGMTITEEIQEKIASQIKKVVQSTR